MFLLKSLSPHGKEITDKIYNFFAILSLDRISTKLFKGASKKKSHTLKIKIKNLKFIEICVRYITGR